jgi:hypothetical protein
MKTLLFDNSHSKLERRSGRRANQQSERSFFHFETENALLPLLVNYGSSTEMTLAD